MRYVAYGLQLHSTFELPGMLERREDELPRLAVELVTLNELAAIREPSESSSYWRGLLGDGRTLTIDRGVRGGRLFTYGDEACFWLDADGLTLSCAPIGGGFDWQRVLLGKVLSSVSVMRGREALHAGAVDSPDGAIAIAAPSGVGKSTLAIELTRRGWPLLSDDVLVLTRERGNVCAHPGTPHVSLSTDAHTTEEAERLGSVIGELASELWVSMRAHACARRSVHAVCLLERGPDLPLAAEVLPATPLPLAPYLLGLPGETSRAASRFALYGELMASAKLIRLTAGSAERPADIADALQATLAADPPARELERVA